MHPLELTGQIFERLTVIKAVDKGINLRWLCQCSCGNTKPIRGADLKRGYVKSCGCLNRELLSERNHKHGLSTDRFHNIWIAMRQRCQNPNSSRYSYYGGRGVIVCERWQEFLNFKEDMYDSYLAHTKEFGKKNTSIDRINNDGNYELNNCKWSTQTEQVNNSRKVLNKMKKDNRTPIQHGENILIPVTSLPAGAAKVYNSLVIAHSESGHSHVLELPTTGASFFEDKENDVLYVELLEQAMLSHQKTHDKHDTLTVKPGIWMVRHKSEYSPLTKLISRVFD